jgi:putative ABC transport system permease protein
MTKLIQHLRYALRQLRKSPGFTAVAALTLALGIGATTAIYTVLYATFLAPMPYPHPEQLVMVWSKIRGERNSVSAGDFLDWKRQSTVFQDLNAWDGGSFNLSTSERPEEVPGHITTPGWFKMQGFHFFLGRDFLPEEGEPGKDHVVILEHRLWERLGANRNIIGQQLRMNGELYTVVGVLAPGVADRLPVQLAVPLAFRQEQINHNVHWLLVMGRMKPGVALAKAQADMDVVTRRIGQDHPESNKSWGAKVEPLRNDFIPPETLLTLHLLMGAVVFVLLIACVNVANLLLAKGTIRQKEVAVRAALGATRRELFTQFLIESLVLAILGALVGIGAGEALVKGVTAIMPPSTLASEAEAAIHIDLPILLFTLITTMLAAILFGCAPAWQASGVDPNDALKEGGRAGASSGRRQLRRSLVVMEFALALTLLSGAGLAIHSFWNLAQVDLGVRTDHILTFSLPVPRGRLSQPEQIVGFYRQLLGKLESIPGVSRAEAATATPVRSRNFGMFFTIVGKPSPDLSSRPNAGFQMVTPGYFQTFGIRVVQGRSFTEQDIPGSLPVAMVNENFVRRYLSGVDPLTQRLAVERLIPGINRNGPAVEWQIVGVFHNVRTGDLRDDYPEIDVPFWQSPWPQAGMAVRTTGDPEAVTKSIAAVASSMDSDLPIADVRTMDQIVSESLGSDRFKAILYATFAGLALLLAAIGIYGVMAFAVAQRTHEIGLRMALGAGRESVVFLILKEGMVLALAGLALGLIGACLVGRTMSGMLYGVATIDITAFGGVAIVLMASAVLACYVPARRAASVDPTVALRYE